MSSWLEEVGVSCWTVCPACDLPLGERHTARESQRRHDGYWENHFGLEVRRTEEVWRGSQLLDAHTPVTRLRDWPVSLWLFRSVLPNVRAPQGWSLPALLLGPYHFYHFYTFQPVCNEPLRSHSISHSNPLRTWAWESKLFTQSARKVRGFEN